VQRLQPCASKHLPLGARPVVQAHPSARIIDWPAGAGAQGAEAAVPFKRRHPAASDWREWDGPFTSEDVFYDETPDCNSADGFCIPAQATPAICRRALNAARHLAAATHGWIARISN